MHRHWSSHISGRIGGVDLASWTGYKPTGSLSYPIPIYRWIVNSECYRMVQIRAVEPDFKKSNNKPDAKVGYRRLYPTLHSKGCCWCFSWIALALVVILRCVWPLWDFSFRSYEHFKIIICLEKIIVTLSRPFLLSIQDISINEVLFCQKSNKKSNPTFPTLSDF